MALRERDFIRRLIEEFAQFLAGLLALRQAGRLDDAERELADASRKLLGPLALDAESLASVSLAKLLSAERLACYCELIAERAEQRAARGDSAGAARDRLRADELRQWLRDRSVSVG